MKAAELQFNAVTETIDLRGHQKLGHWWRELLQKRTKAGEEQLAQKINLELRANSFSNNIHEE